MKEKVKAFRPLNNYVMIKNPLFGKIDDLEAKFEKLPPQDKEAELNKVMKLWEGVEIISVGPDVIGAKINDKAIIAETAIPALHKIFDGEYLLVKETAILGVW